MASGPCVWRSCTKQLCPLAFPEWSLAILGALWCFLPLLYLSSPSILCFKIGHAWMSTGEVVQMEEVLSSPTCSGEGLSLSHSIGVTCRIYRDSKTQHFAWQSIVSSFSFQDSDMNTWVHQKAIFYIDKQKILYI